MATPYYFQGQFNKYLEKLVKFYNCECKKTLADFSKLRKLEDKVRFTYQLLKESGGLAPKSEINFNKNICQSTQTYAECLRVTGNGHFLKQEYVLALECYNTALCFSRKGSKIMGLAYANRSAVYFNTGFYKLCLENIELALQNGYPEELKFKLVKRKNDALYELDQGREKKVKPALEPKLSYPPNPTIPFMVEGIEMKEDKKYGRHLVAKQNFKPGDILLIEKPLVAGLYLNNVYRYCFYCLESNFMSLLPCDEAISVMFCSEKCYKEGLKKFFKYERQIVDAIYGMQEVRIAVYRMFFEIISLVKDFDGLKKFLDSVDLDKNPFQTDYRSATRLDLFRSYFTLESHENSRSNAQNFQLSFEAAFAYHLIASCTDLRDLMKSKDHEDTLMKFLFRSLMIWNTNGQRLGKLNALLNDTSKTVKKGMCSPLLIQLLNHSCSANSVLLVGGADRHILMTTRPIKAGQQIFLSYGQFHYDMLKSERQQSLKKLYFFDCKCEACLKNWPLAKDTKPRGLDFKHIATKILNLENTLHKANNNESLIKAVKMCNVFLEKNDKFMPCQELFMVDDYQETCCLLLYADEPLEVSFAHKK